MTMITNIVICLVAILHAGFLVLEMFLWNTPSGLKIFGQSKTQARATTVLAANQGLYNGFIAAGLFWGMVQGEAGDGLILFLLCCVVVAGVFGALTASRKILYVQALPGLAGLLLFVFFK